MLKSSFHAAHCLRKPNLQITPNLKNGIYSFSDDRKTDLKLLLNAVWKVTWLDDMLDCYVIYNLFLHLHDKDSDLS